MQWKHAALGALLAGGAYLGVEALRGEPEDAGVSTAANPAPDVAVEEAVEETVVAESADAASAPGDAAQSEIEARLAAAEAERDRLRLELDQTAAERDALAEELAAREAEAPAVADTPPPAAAAEETVAASDEAPSPTAEVVKLLADLAAQAAEIDRLKAELGARDAELVALRETAEVLPVAPETPNAVLVVAPAQMPGEATPSAQAVADAVFAARLEAAKSGVPLPRPVSPLTVAATQGSTTAATAPLALVLFERGSASLTAGGADRAAAAAAALAGLDAGRIRVTGHSDTTGSPDANMRLSLARAEAVAAALIAAGLPADSIEIAPHGQAPDALPIPTGVGVAEPLNRCAGIFVLASAE